MSLLFENFLNSWQKEHDPLASLSEKDRLEEFKREHWQTLWFSLKVDEIKLDGILIGKDPRKTKRSLPLFSGNKQFWETFDDARDTCSTPLMQMAFFSIIQEAETAQDQSIQKR